MELSVLKSQIKSGNLQKYYIFTGSEVEVMRIYINQIAKVKNATVKNLASITELAQKLNTRSVLKNTLIYVIRDDKTFMCDDSIQAKITHSIATTDNVAVFVYSNIDKRSKLYKNYKEDIVEFEPLKVDILIKYIQRDIDLNEKNCRALAEICERDYSRILLEIDKIKQFGNVTYREVHGGGYDANAAFEYLIKDGTIYRPPYDAVFDFVDAVLKNRPKLSFNLLEQSYASGEATLVLLSNLYNSTKQLLQVQSYRGDNLSQATGLTSFQIKLAKDRMNNYSLGDLVYLMKLTRDAEKGIKTGEIDDMMAVPYVLVNLWN